MKMKALTLFSFLLSAQTIFACAISTPDPYLLSEQPYEPESQSIYSLKLLASHFFQEAAAEKVNPERIKRDSAAVITEDLTHAFKATPEQIRLYLEFDAACRRGDSTIAPDLPPKSREFILYSQGWQEIARDKTVASPEAWKTLLAMPEENRRYRTVWTLYMLGNLKMRHKKADEAYQLYRQLRDAVFLGMFDTNQLVRASYIANYKTAEPLERLKYFAVAATQIPVTEYEYRIYRDSAIAHDRPGMVKDPLLRELLLPEVINELPDSTTFLLAERMASNAYFNNELELCQKLLSKVDSESMIKLYLEARFAKRDRDWKTAADKLRQWLELYETKKIRGYDFIYSKYESWYDKKFFEEVKGVLGTVLVEKKDFVEALDAFMKANSTYDARFVAEQYISSKDLIAYCRNHTSSATDSGRWLQHILARRMMREYRFKEAEKWMPDNLKPLTQTLATLDSVANNTYISKDIRATALLNQGNMFLSHYKELFDGMTSNDYTYYEQFALHNFYNGKKYKTHKIFPHITAIQYYTRGAAIAEDSDLKVAGYYLAGNFLAIRYPEIADMYYKLLVDQRPHPLAIKADKKRWFPIGPELKHDPNPETDEALQPNDPEDTNYGNFYEEIMHNYKERINNVSPYIPYTQKEFKKFVNSFE